MLYSILLLATHRADGIARFEQFFSRTKSFSVQVKATSISAGTGTGTLTILKPASVRITMKWVGSDDYTYVKSPVAAVEFERTTASYMEFPNESGLNLFQSSISDFKGEAYPGPLLSGNLSSLVPPANPFALTDTQGGIETYSSSWSGGDGSQGRVIAKIAGDGRLMYFEHFMQTPRGTLHRKFDLSNYSVPAKTTAATFSLVPPLGFEMHHRPTPFLSFEPGDTVKLGTWKSRNGSVAIDSKVRGKLLVVREPQSAPADALLNFLKKRKLPVGMIVASLGASGGDFWSPSADVRGRLAAVGTPLCILFDKKGVIAGMWLGYDPSDPAKLIKELKDALEGNFGR